jgi:hypothetical protein
VFVKGDTLAVVLGLAPGIHNAWPQAGCYEVIQRGNELFVDHEPVRFSSVSVKYLPVKLLAYSNARACGIKKDTVTED